MARRRRTRAEISFLRHVMYDVVSRDAPMTVRQVSYRLVGLGVIDKTESEYWRELDDYVEVWLEKDALAGVLFQVTDEWGVPLMVTRGFASLSYVHNAAETIERVGKPTHIYYFGDYDPSGVEIDRNLERRLREFAPGSEIHFERIAVRREQIDEYALPTRPTKRGANHGRGLHEGESVEVDAIPPASLLRLVRGCIERHVDPSRVAVLEAAEASERELLGGLAGMLRKEVA